MNKYLGLVSMIKDEREYLKEWIHFHLDQGFQKILLFDNDSVDSPSQVLSLCNFSKYCEIFPWPSSTLKSNTQLDFLKFAIKKFSEFRWLACIDVDEFMFQKNGSSMVDFLADYEDSACLKTAWRNFGYGGNIVPPTHGGGSI